MSLSAIYSKSGKGAQVLTGKSKALPADFMRVLAQVDGKLNAKAIMATLENFTKQELTQILEDLLEGGYIRVIADDAVEEFFPESGIASAIDVVEISEEEFYKTETSAHALNSDVKIRQQKEAGERAKAHGEEQLKLQAAARVQKESERKLLEVADLLAKSASKTNVVELSKEKAKHEAKSREAAAARTKREVEARFAAEQKAREGASAKAKADAEVRERAERKAREEAEALAEQNTKDKTRLAAEQKAREGAKEAVVRAKAETEARAEREAETKAQEEAETEASERAERKAREEAKARAESEAEEKAKREAEARLAAEQKARERAEEAVVRAQAEAEARAEREAETKAREEAEALAEQVAEEKARIEAEAKEREEAERAARKQAEVEEKTQARLKAKRETEEKARIKAIEKARKREEREPIDVGRWLRNTLTIGWKLLISLSVTALVLLLLLQLVSLSMPVSPLVGPIEKLISANINEPVTINKVYASLWPKPHLVLDGVTVGGLADIKIAKVRVLPVLSTVFDDVKTLRYIELSGLAIGQDDLRRPLQWTSTLGGRGKLKFNQIFLEKTSVTLHGLKLPPFDGNIKLASNGELQSAILNTDDRSAIIQITPKDATYMIDMVANDWQSPIGAPVVFNELHAAGVIDHNQLNLTQIKGRLYGGNIKAAMVVDWANQWGATGTFKLSEVELEELMPNFTKEASLKGPLTSNATFTLQANEFAAILDTPEINASFSVDDGTINGIDLARAIRAINKNDAISGSTKFNKFTGKLLLKDGHYQYKQLALNEGQLGASGEADILADQDLSGEIDINLAMQSRQLRSHLNLSGTLGSPTLK